MVRRIGGYARCCFGEMLGSSCDNLACCLESLRTGGESDARVVGAASFADGDTDTGVASGRGCFGW